MLFPVPSQPQDFFLSEIYGGISPIYNYFLPLCPYSILHVMSSLSFCHLTIHLGNVTTSTTQRTASIVLKATERHIL